MASNQIFSIIFLKRINDRLDEIFFLCLGEREIIIISFKIAKTQHCIKKHLS